MENDILKKTATGSIHVSNDPNNNRACYKCGQPGHLSQDCKQPKANVRHVGPDDSKEDNKPSDDNKNEDKDDSQVAEKNLTASSNNPSLTLDLDPTAKELLYREDSLMDLDASPKCYLTDKEELKKDLLHQVMAVNAVTRRQAIMTKALPLCEAIETVTIPYYEQLSHHSS
ncbi:hypothetical protein DSO57_1004234 [Entomophthora muscae]|uniref:Uncharacterized protein n=1 Tax=Entomophthora muscae TaxID=34485 RepID=A0ACC2SA38_9FUNG|nr:hypothetical protein DSO57_1004234 [Entomophthora muscae]